MAKTTPSETETGRTPARQPAAGGNPVVELRRQMDRLFDDFARGWGWPGLAGWPSAGGLLDLAEGGGMLAVDFDVNEDDKAIEIKADLPGLSRDDVDISLDDGVLTVRGEKKSESEKADKDYHLSERRYGAFRRSFRLPEGIDESKISAAFDKGVLTLTLPKTAEARRKAKKIAIKGG